MRGALAALLLTLPIAGLPGAAHALDAIAMDDAHPVIDLTPYVETYEAEGRLTIEPPQNGSADVEADPEAEDVDESELEDGSIVLSDERRRRRASGAPSRCAIAATSRSSGRWSRTCAARGS